MKSFRGSEDVLLPLMGWRLYRCSRITGIHRLLSVLYRSIFCQQQLQRPEQELVPWSGWSDPRASAAGVPPPPSQLSQEAHAGFAHVASMLVGQGIVDPAGEQHLTSVIVEFFEARMVSALQLLENLSLSHRDMLWWPHLWWDNTSVPEGSSISHVKYKFRM